MSDESSAHLIGYEPTAANGYIDGMNIMTSDSENYYISVKTAGDGNSNKYFIYKVNKADGKAQKLCSDTDCSHDNNQCQAAVENMPVSLAVWDGKLYWAETSDENSSYNTRIICEDINGSQHRLVCDIGESSHAAVNVIFCNGKACIENSSFCDDCQIVRIDLSTGEKEHFIEKSDGEYLGEIKYYNGQFYAVISRETDGGSISDVYRFDPETEEIIKLLDGIDDNIFLIGTDIAYFTDDVTGGEYVAGSGFKAMATRDFGRLCGISFADGSVSDVSSLGKIVDGDGLYRHNLVITKDRYVILYYDDSYNYSVAIKNLSDGSVSVCELGTLEQVAFENESGLNINNITSGGCDGENVYVIAQKIEYADGVSFGDLPVRYNVIYSVPLTGGNAVIIYDDRQGNG